MSGCGRVEGAGGCTHGASVCELAALVAPIVASLREAGRRDGEPRRCQASAFASFARVTSLGEVDEVGGARGQFVSSRPRPHAMSKGGNKGGGHGGKMPDLAASLGRAQRRTTVVCHAANALQESPMALDARLWLVGPPGK